MTLLELAKQYKSDVETRIECIKDECDMGIKEADSDEVGHWEVTLRIIRKTIAEHKRMAKQKVGNWIVIVGYPIFTCKTRKQAREFAKRDKVHYPKYNYVGKCVDNNTKIILDV